MRFLFFISIFYFMGAPSAFSEENKVNFNFQIIDCYNGVEQSASEIKKSKSMPTMKDFQNSFNFGVGAGLIIVDMEENVCRLKKVGYVAVVIKSDKLEQLRKYVFVHVVALDQ